MSALYRLWQATTSKNTGNEDLIFLELFAAPEYQDMSLNQWLRALPPHVARAHTNLSADELERIPAQSNKIVG